MKLAFCIFKYYPFGGLEKNFLRILEEVLRRGHSVTVFTMSWEGEIPDFITDSDCTIQYVPCSGLTNHSRCASYVKKLQPQLAEGNFDLIVGYNRMPGLDLYYCADVCFTADIRRRHSKIYQLTKRYRVFSEFEKSIFSADAKTHILALSEIQRKLYQEEYGTPDERFHPVPAGIDKQKIRNFTNPEQQIICRKKFGLQENEKMLLMVGSDFQRKGAARSIEAVAALPESTKALTKLFIVGKGKIKKMKTLAQKLNITGNVILPGAVSNVPEYLAAADFLLHPAISENTGNAIVEALIAGIPVITTSNCGYAFHVVKSGAGFVVEGLDFSQEELNKKLLEALSMPDETISSWRKKAEKYADKTDFYSRPTAVAEIIENLEKGKS